MPEISSAEFYAGLKHKRTGIHPEHWPPGVEIISVTGLDVLGLGEDGALYLDGQKLHTEKRWGRQERWIAWTVAFFTAVGAIATVAQALK